MRSIFLCDQIDTFDMVNGTVMQRSVLNSDYHILLGLVRARSGACSGAFGRVRVRSGAFGRGLVGPFIFVRTPVKNLQIVPYRFRFKLRQRFNPSLFIIETNLVV